jgi:DNA-directed RNA polymerase subunit RPC12/RpoP
MKILKELLEMHHEYEEEGEKCIRCRQGTMQPGDTMMGPAKECDRCGYQQQVDEEEEDEVKCDNCGSKDVYKYDIEDEDNPGRVGHECNKCGEGWEY